MQTAVNENVVDQPDQRPFGSRVPKESTVNLQKSARIAAVIGGVLVVGIGAFAMYAKVSQEKAPKINLQVVRPAEIVPAQALQAPAPEVSTVPAQPSPKPAAAVQVPTTETASGAIVATGNPTVQEQIIELTDRLEGLSTQLKETKAEVDSLKRGGRPVTGKSIVVKSKADEFLALSVLEISANAIVVSDASNQYTIRPGAQLPGGATYIGFDPASRLMKTNRGDFLIP